VPKNQYKMYGNPNNNSIVLNPDSVVHSPTGKDSTDIKFPLKKKRTQVTGKKAISSLVRSKDRVSE
jgi:hypothetical protein